MSPIAKKSNRRLKSEEKIDDDIPLVYCIFCACLTGMWKACGVARFARFGPWYYYCMKSLREYVQEAKASRRAIGHFNIANIDGFWAVVNAAEILQVPVIIGVSEGERDFVGIAQVVALVRTVREGSNGKPGLPVFLNADHTYSVERVKEAIDAGFDAVIYDGTELPFDENVANAKACVEYAAAVKQSTGRDVMVESEIGFIGKSSKVLSAIPEGVKITEEFLTTPVEAKKFIELTGVDMLAPAVGNIHGMLKGGKDPALNTRRIAEISAETGVPLVLRVRLEYHVLFPAPQAGEVKDWNTTPVRWSSILVSGQLDDQATFERIRQVLELIFRKRAVVPLVRPLW